MQSHRRHDMNKKATKSDCGAASRKPSLNDLPDHLVHAMKDQRIAPHCNRNCIIPKYQTECADKQTLGLREDPEAQYTHQVDEVTEIRQKVVVSLLVVAIVSNWHEVDQLATVPNVEVLWVRSNKDLG